MTCITYYCLDCGGIFDHPSGFMEYHNGKDSPAEHIDVCPFCVSTDFIEAKICDICHGYIIGDYVETRDGQTICDDCYTVHNTCD